MSKGRKSPLDLFVEDLLKNSERAEAAETEAVAADIPDLGMSLDQFEQEGRVLEIKTSWLAGPLWFVPSAAEAEGLVKDGVSRGRVWTAQELRDLLAIPGVTREQVTKVATAKAIFQGELLA